VRPGTEPDCFPAWLINGFGTGILNTIVPVWATESVPHTGREQFVAIEFTLNIFGAVVAYWLELQDHPVSTLLLPTEIFCSGLSFIDNGASQIRWRFAIAFQIIPLWLLFIGVWWFPESSRWLVKVGREEEARYILGRLRGNEGEEKDLAEVEFQDIRTVSELEKRAGNRTSY
jgi:MFS family permease